MYNSAAQTREHTADGIQVLLNTLKHAKLIDGQITVVLPSSGSALSHCPCYTGFQPSTPTPNPPELIFYQLGELLNSY